MTNSISLTPSELARFNSFLDKNNAEHPGCWIWTGAKAKGGGKRKWHTDGYPIFQATTLQPKTRRAHRLAYQIWNGKIPPLLQVNHTCNVPLCCNPDHLVIGTAAENSAYMVQCGRAATGLRHGLAKLSPEQILEIRRLCDEGPITKMHQKGNEKFYAEVGAKFGITASHVRNIWARRRGLNDDAQRTSRSDGPSGERSFT
jgi:HNH endonuclease